VTPSLHEICGRLPWDCRFRLILLQLRHLVDNGSVFVEVGAAAANGELIRLRYEVIPHV